MEVLACTRFRYADDPLDEFKRLVTLAAEANNANHFATPTCVIVP